MLTRKPCHFAASVAVLVLFLFVSSFALAEERQWANPTQPTYPNDALFQPAGYLQLETSYLAQVFEGPTSAFQTFHLLTSLTVAELFETRLRWDVFNFAGDVSGMGDLSIGLKGGFYGGWDPDSSLAAIVELRFPNGAEPFSIGEGIELFAGMIGTHIVSAFQLDLQVAVETHIFTDDPTVGLPIGFAATWAPIGNLNVYGDFVLGLDLQNLSDSTTSLLVGAGYGLLPVLSLDAGARVGLSESLPDVSIVVGMTWLAGKVF